MVCVLSDLLCLAIGPRDALYDKDLDNLQPVAATEPIINPIK